MITEIPQGQTLNIYANLPQAPSEYVNVYAWVYTSENMPVKFSFNTRVGYLPMVISTAPARVKCVVPASLSKKFSGKLYIAFFLNDSEPSVEDIGNKTKFTNIEIIKSPISSEA